MRKARFVSILVVGLMAGLSGVFAAAENWPQYRGPHAKKIAPEGRASFTSSPWAYNGKIFCLSEQGETYVLEAGPEFKLLHQNSLGEMCMSLPAILDDSIVIRTISKLYRIKK